MSIQDFMFWAAVGVLLGISVYAIYVETRRDTKFQTRKITTAHEHQWTTILGPRCGDGMRVSKCTICDKRLTEKLGKEAGERAWRKFKANPHAGWPCDINCEKGE